jgi:hypothetical protein
LVSHFQENVRYIHRKKDGRYVSRVTCTEYLAKEEIH